MKIGYIGLGKMGKNMVLRLLDQGIEIAAYNRSPEPREEVKKAGAEVFETIEELIKSLPTPRIIWLMLPAGPVIDETLTKLMEIVSPGDLIIDGGNSFYKDTLHRGELLKTKNIKYMDIGVSGGPDGARTGACLMIGGEKADFEMLMPVISAASFPEAYGYFGKLGSGHFAKMVHNGIEYGMMEAIGEGAAVLKASDFNLNLSEVFRVYNLRSVIESRLVGWTREALAEDPNLSSVSPIISASGEGEWTVKTAKEMAVPVPIIEKSVEVRSLSKSDASPQAVFRNKVVTALRGKFGHHAVNLSK